MGTGIEWADETWNFIRGCSRVSEGCRHCYAERTAGRFSGPGQPYDGLVTIKRGRQMQVNLATGEPTGKFRDATLTRWTGEVSFVAERLADPLRWKKPRRIFVNSMSDMFHEKLSNEQIAAVFGVMAAAQHTFQVLTKRAKRMREWFEWVVEHDVRTCAKEALLHLGGVHDCPWEAAICADWRWPLPNVWLGTSVENRAALERLDDLRACPAALRFVSAEPLLEDLGKIDLSDIGWLIAGCESGPGARPCEVDWLRSLRDQCAAADVPFFLKQARETKLGVCGDSDNPNGPRPCGKPVTAYVIDQDTAAYSCGCTVEGSEVGACVPLGEGEGSKRKAGGIIGAPYLDGVQHLAFPEVRA